MYLFLGKLLHQLKCSLAHEFTACHLYSLYILLLSALNSPKPVPQACENDRWEVSTSASTSSAVGWSWGFSELRPTKLSAQRLWVRMGLSC